MKAAGDARGTLMRADTRRIHGKQFSDSALSQNSIGIHGECTTELFDLVDGCNLMLTAPRRDEFCPVDGCCESRSGQCAQKLEDKKRRTMLATRLAANIPAGDRITVPHSIPSAHGPWSVSEPMVRGSL